MNLIAALPWVWEYSPDAWTALATWAAVIAAVVAGLYARAQLEEARKTRLAQAQPFVSIDLEPSGPSRIHMDLVIRNTGTTVARDVRFLFDKPLQSTMDDEEGSLREAAILRVGIPTLPPGREHRMLFENMPDLYKSDLPRRYDVTVIFEDIWNQTQELTYRLDADIFYDYDQLVVYGEHDTAVALREMRELMKSWTANFNGIRTYANDEDKLRADRNATFEEARRVREAADSESQNDID